jgi:hypothetical protein
LSLDGDNVEKKRDGHFSWLLMEVIVDRNVTVMAHSAETPNLSWSFKLALFDIALILPKKVWNFLSTFLVRWGVQGPENSNLIPYPLILHSSNRALFSEELLHLIYFTSIPVILRSVSSVITLTLRLLLSF